MNAIKYSKIQDVNESCYLPKLTRIYPTQTNRQEYILHRQIDKNISYTDK